MKIINKTPLLLILIQFSAGITGCKKFVEIAPPNTLLASSSVFSNAATATSAITNIYQEMYNNVESFDMAQHTGWLGDELISYSSNVLDLPYYTNSMDAVSSTYGPWTNAYNYIYQANAIIEGLTGNNVVSAPIQHQLTGEAKFLRAFWLFYLTNCYGDIPLTTTTIYQTNAALARTPRADVFRQLANDLSDAQNLMTDNFIDASDTVVANDRIRPNKWTAKALLARAYLYMGKYDSAEIAATEVINNTGLFGLVGLDSVFSLNNREAIWQLGIPAPYSFNTYDGNYFVLQGIPGSTSGQPQSLSPQLLKAFETGDSRRGHWVDSIITTGPNDTFYFPYKYKVWSSTVTTEINTIMRLGEQYLIRSEARAQQQNITGATGAIADLNVIRARANLTGYAGATDQSSVLTAILHERQVELFTEWGHRWFDLIRTGNVNTVMGAPGNVTLSKGGTWDPDWQLFPIPQSEINSDPKLSQNKGY